MFLIKMPMFHVFFPVLAAQNLHFCCFRSHIFIFVPILFFRQGVETSGEGAAARASAEPEARPLALLAVAGAGSHALGDAADRRPDLGAGGV